jgi:D-alanine-D-alanine ligase
MNNIAVVYGGYSSEREISIKSGKYVASIIDKNKFRVFEIDINKKSWLAVDYQKQINKADFSLQIGDEKIHFDAAVIVIHGNPGENGVLQAYFDMLQIPYTSCNTLSSALTFNKFYANNFLRSFDIKIAKSIVLRKEDREQEKLQKFIDLVGLPVFVKPSAGGSSFGTTKVKKEDKLQFAINEAFKEADEVLVEEFIEGRELTCGVVKMNGQIRTLTPIEVVSKNEFFDYEAKYNSNLNEEIIPAPVDKKIITEIKKISEKIYQLLNCSGIVRIDYILKKNELFFLELNSVPGMTSESIVPKMIRYENLNITELFTNLIEDMINH